MAAAIDTITSKMVLILGRFRAERKPFSMPCGRSCASTIPGTVSNCGRLRKPLWGRQLIPLPGPLFSPGLEHRPPHDGVGRFGLPNVRAVISEVLQYLGAAGDDVAERAESADVKARLRARTKEAQRCGIFGAAHFPRE
ncbi:MAG: hypothetical protein ACM30D_17610 [Hyphomicrobiales bacterium]